jgi:hypothetical protein
MAGNITQIQCIKCSKIFSRNSASDRLHTAECNEVKFISVDNKFSILEKLLQFYKKEVKEEDINIQKILLQGLSAFTPNPINMRIFAPSGEGKTYLIDKISATFPEDSLIILSSASAQSFKYSHGIEVIEEENGDLTPIDEKLAPLNDELDKATGKQKKEIESKIKQLHKESWYLIDFRNKWLIFLDSQNMSLWESLKTLLSHDSEKQKHQVTNKVGGRNTQERMIFRGSPAVTYCSAKDESKYDIASEMDTRFETIHLKNNPVKYEKSIDLISKKSMFPSEIYEEEVVSKQDLEDAKELVQILIENVKMFGSKKNSVSNLYSEKLGKLYPKSSGATSREYTRLMQMITMLTLCNSNDRCKLIMDENRYPVTQLQDIEKAVSLIKQKAVLPTPKIQFFNDIFKPIFKEIAESGNLSIEHNIKVVTASMMAEAIVKKHPEYSKIDRKKITETYLDTFVEYGILENARDFRNSSRYVYWITNQYENKDVDYESTLIDTSSLDQSCLESVVDKYFKQRFEDGRLTIVNSKNEEISLEVLIQNISLDKDIKNATKPLQNSYKITSNEVTNSDDSENNE